MPVMNTCIMNTVSRGEAGSPAAVLFTMICSSRNPSMPVIKLSTATDQFSSPYISFDNPKEVIRNTARPSNWLSTTWRLLAEISAYNFLSDFCFTARESNVFAGRAARRRLVILQPEA